MDTNSNNKTDSGVTTVMVHKSDTNNTNKAIYGIFHTLMALLAIYLSFRCNDNKFNAASFVVAFCCPYIYIIYILATKGTCSK